MCREHFNEQKMFGIWCPKESCCRDMSRYCTLPQPMEILTIAEYVGVAVGCPAGNKSVLGQFNTRIQKSINYAPIQAMVYVPHLHTS